MKMFNMFFVAVTVMLAQFASAANEVTVQYARLYQSDLSGSCEVCTRFTGVVEVKNIAYSKQVIVHYQTGFTGWTSQAAQYIGPSRAGYEYWGFKSNQLGTTADFAVEYKVNGQVYWDNNMNANYFIQTEEPLIVNNNIKVLLTRDELLEIRRFPDFIGVLGSIHVQNLGAQKNVKVRYTTNAWATWNEVPAQYSATASNGLERWGFNLELPLDATQLELVVSYTVNGQTYWDSNLGRNYRYPLPQ